MTWRVKTSLPVEFEINKVPDALNFWTYPGQRRIAVIDRNVYNLYKDRIPAGVEHLIIDASESEKHWTNAEQVLSFFEEKSVLRRSEPIIAIGGGVLLDLVGFCCSIYRRGIPYIRIPTTLLAIVDASVGAKTSINHFGRRNRIGSFYPPVQTLIDTSFIKTQESREISNGLAEILKLAIVLDRELFEMIETSAEDLLATKFQNLQVADSIIDRSIAGMTQELNDNLWEKDLKRVVDFGHSFSPMVEMKNVPNLLHGEAVILDCLLSSCISNIRGKLSDSELKRIFAVVKSCNLATDHKDFYDVDLLWSGLCDVMNHRNGNQYLPLPTSIGHCLIINDLTYSELETATQRLKSLQ
jgi:3-dehydroquinate synthase